ncbi:MAG: metalloregulator ArsR/SmtB family transcription factor [Propionibacteriaceae bacterium]|jgi:DNA-binding transcriptional ArsR family regulator|nr:metalloregulator ArsR/SmtB family transcription factor [Propionibacteriaceae bacterium]
MNLTEADAEHVAEVMGGLANTGRVLILARLLESPATVTQLVDDLDMGQTTVSNHLRILRHLDLASGKRDGRNVVYELADDHVRELLTQVLNHASHS